MQKKILLFSIEKRSSYRFQKRSIPKGQKVNAGSVNKIKLFALLKGAAAPATLGTFWNGDDHFPEL